LIRFYAKDTQEIATVFFGKGPPSLGKGDGFGLRGRKKCDPHHADIPAAGYPDSVQCAPYCTPREKSAE